MKRLIRLLLLFFLIPVFALLSIVIADLLVENYTSDKVYDELANLPENRVGLLLGTNRYMNSGTINRYYKYRIDAAADLYKSGKISYILASGDNSRVGYDEPEMMREDLMAKGVPSSKIFLDYAGFRTLDSVVRAKEIFGQSSITFISQQFHNERAICIAAYKGMDAVGYNARGVSLRSGIKVVIRERLARVKMVLDLLIGKGPKFLGDPIEIA